MNIDRRRLVLPVLLVALGGCTQGFVTHDEPVIEFGEMNRQTMAAQVINPEPEYDTEMPVTSAEHAAQAVDRHATDTVKPPEHVPSTTPNSGN